MVVVGGGRRGHSSGSAGGRLAKPCGLWLLPMVWLLAMAQDPWCVPARATQIERYYALAQRTDICRHVCQLAAMGAGWLCGWRRSIRPPRAYFTRNPPPPSPPLVQRSLPARRHSGAGQRQPGRVGAAAAGGARLDLS